MSKEVLRDSDQGRAIGQAARYIGRMNWRGECVPLDAEEAYEWFVVGAQFNNAMSQNGLGMMYLDSVVVPKVCKRANTVERICKSMCVCFI